MKASNFPTETSEWGWLYKISMTILAVSSWISGIFFVLFIVDFYLLADTLEKVQAWNNILPQLYTPTQPAAMTGMIGHFFTGSLLLIFGPIQFSSTIRKNYTAFHRWVGITYTGAAFITGLGGLVFMLILGAAGGITMLIGFGIYGILMMVTSVQTVRFAMLRRFDAHRAWAIRLYALALGSWLYRMGYGLAFQATGTKGMGINYNGPLDYFMDFAFFVIPLLIAEVVIKGRASSAYSFWKMSGAALGFIATGAIWWSTLFWLNAGWGAAIRQLVS